MLAPPAKISGGGTKHGSTSRSNPADHLALPGAALRALPAALALGRFRAGHTGADLPGGSRPGARPATGTARGQRVAKEQPTPERSDPDPLSSRCRVGSNSTRRPVCHARAAMLDGDRVAVARLDVGVGLLAAAHTLHPVTHVVDTLRLGDSLLGKLLPRAAPTRAGDHPPVQVERAPVGEVALRGPAEGVGLARVILHLKAGRVSKTAVNVSALRRPSFHW